jgi:hypothetical protein
MHAEASRAAIDETNSQPGRFEKIIRWRYTPTVWPCPIN